MIVHANAVSATVGSLEGGVLELVFPPGRTFAASKVEQKQEDLRAVLLEMFGIDPQVRCTVREGSVPDPADVEPEEDTPASPESAEELLRQQFGAQPVTDPED